MCAKLKVQELGLVANQWTALERLSERKQCRGRLKRRHPVMNEFGEFKTEKVSRLKRNTEKRIIGLDLLPTLVDKGRY